MIGAVIRSLGHGNVIVPLRKAAVAGIDIADKLCIVRISPELCRMFPGNLSTDLHAVRQLIKADIFHIRIVLHDQANVMQ